MDPSFWIRRQSVLEPPLSAIKIILEIHFKINDKNLQS